MAKLSRQYILQARALAQDSNWPELLAHCVQAEQPTPEILLNRLTAACMVKDDAAVRDALKIFESFGPDDAFYAVPRHLTKVARILEAAHRLEQAGEALLHGATKMEWESVHYFVAGRLARITPEPNTIKARLKEQIAKGIPLAKDSEYVSAPSNFRFPPFEPAKSTGYADPTIHKFVVTGSTEALAPTVERFYQFRTRFLPRLTPEAPEPFPLYENVFVNRIGQIWTEDGKIVNSCGRPIPEEDLAVDNPTEVEEGVAMLLGVKGVYHWLAEMFSSISWAASPEAAHVKIVVPAEVPKFKLDSLRLGGFRDDQIVPLQGSVCFFKKLHSPGAYQRAIFYSVDFFEAMIKRAQAEATIPVESRRLYITRRDSKRRVLENGQELEDELTKRGFYIAELSKMSLADQITLFANTPAMVGPHGAGNTHIIFSRPGTKVFEIVPAFDGMLDGTIHLRFNYARMSMMKGLNYHSFLQDTPPTKDAWSVDLPLVLQRIDAMLG